MRYISTRGQAPELGFEEAMLSGLALDGGLYVPRSVPELSMHGISALAGQPYEEVAFQIMRPFIGDAFDDATFQALIAEAYKGFNHSARAGLRQIGPNHFLLDLFHGPTLAFKDFAMQLIGQLFGSILEKRDERLTIIAATSGDTGSAAIEAFAGIDRVDVFILFPDGRVSEVQRRQMTTNQASNVHALALTGDFDDCQARVKDLFNDHAFRDEARLGAVNSINWARILAQIVYYFSAATALGAPHRKISFSVPTGNFGDIYAGHIARKMGLPIDKLVIATNHNDILHRALSSGHYAPDAVHPSLSPSMDIQVSSNFERALFEAYEEDASELSNLMHSLKEGGSFLISNEALKWLERHFISARVSEGETLAEMERSWRKSGILLCPHSAVGVHAGESYAHPSSPMITLATAHPAKFPDAVELATGIHPELPSNMQDLYEREERVHSIPNTSDAIKNFIRERRSA